MNRDHTRTHTRQKPTLLTAGSTYLDEVTNETVVEVPSECHQRLTWPRCARLQICAQIVRRCEKWGAIDERWSVRDKTGARDWQVFLCNDVSPCMVYKANGGSTFRATHITQASAFIVTQWTRCEHCVWIHMVKRCSGISIVTTCWDGTNLLCWPQMYENPHWPMEVCTGSRRSTSMPLTLL